MSTRYYTSTKMGLDYGSASRYSRQCYSIIQSNYTESLKKAIQCLPIKISFYRMSIYHCGIHYWMGSPYSHYMSNIIRIWLIPIPAKSAKNPPFTRPRFYCRFGGWHVLSRERESELEWAEWKRSRGRFSELVMRLGSLSGFVFNLFLY